MSTTEGAFYYPPLENLPIFDVLVFRNAQDVTDFAINSENSLITNTTSGTPYYPTFVDSSSGYERIRTNDPSYTYNANTNTISANTSGTAASASTIALTSDNTSGTYYIPFSKTTSATSNALYIDNVTTPLTYTPDSSILRMGSIETTNNSNVNSLFLGSKNSATIFMTYGVGLPALTTGDFNVIMGGNIGNALAGGSNNFALGYNAFNANENGCNNCIMGHRAALGLGASGNFYTWYNVAIGDTSLTNANDVAESTCIGWGTGGSMINSNLKCTCIGAGADCADGLSYATAIGAGVTVTTNDTVKIGRAADTTIFDGTVTNTIAQPAAGDSSTKVPTTAWVQTAITAGSVTTTANIALTSDDTAGTYYIPFSKTTSPTSNALYIDDVTTPLTYNPNTSTLTASNFSGLASQSTTIAVAVDNTATTYYPTFTSTGAGQKALLFDTTTTPLSYVPSTSTLTATNYTGSTYNLTTTITSSLSASIANLQLVNPNIAASFDYVMTPAVGIPFTMFSLSETNSFMRQTFLIDNEVSATKYSLGGLAPVSGANAGFFAQNTGSFASVIQNQATSGFVFLNTRTALNALTTSLSVSSTAASFNAANVTLSGTSINMGQGAGGTSNLIVGNTNAKSVVFTTGQNTIVGTSAGQNMTVASTSNTLIGNNAGLGITSSTQNTFVGYGTGNQVSGTGAGNNVAVGFSAGAAMITTATQNTLVGVIAASGLTTGTGNIVMGFGAASGLLTGASNTVIGLQAGDLMTGSTNIVIGANAEVPTVANSNQIAIGTVTETMFIRGGFNLRVGTQITSTATGNLATAVLAQFYTVAMSAAAQTIALPNPTGAAYLGAMVTFKRKTNTTIFTLTSTGGAGFVPISAIGLSASPHSVAAGIFQVTLVCDGVNWNIINQA
jgi:hypothetical protein